MIQGAKNAARWWSSFVYSLPVALFGDILGISPCIKEKLTPLRPSLKIGTESVSIFKDIYFQGYLF